MTKRYLKTVLKYFTKKEVHEKTGATPKTIRNWEKTGNFPEKYNDIFGLELRKIKRGKK